jgi:hypothetical protein
MVRNNLRPTTYTCFEVLKIKTTEPSWPVVFYLCSRVSGFGDVSRGFDFGLSSLFIVFLNTQFRYGIAVLGQLQIPSGDLERETGLKPATYALARHRSIN